MRKILAISFVLFTGTFAFSQNQFQRVFNKGTRPLKENMRIDFADDMGNTGHLPITIIKGINEGPVFTVVAGVHGFEYPPIVATQALLQEIDANKLSGTLIILPISNIESFHTRTPFINPQDGVNLNGAFPGDPAGSITRRMAHFITENIISVSDVFLDIHGGDACEDLMPFICYYDNKKKPKQTAMAKKLSDVSGFEYVVSYAYTISDDEPAKYTFKQAVQDGKTALSIESGRLGNVEKEAVDLVKEGVYNMLKEMKMYEKGNGTNHEIVRLNQQAYVRSGKSGIFYSSHQAGDKVVKGEVIGYTTDEFGNLLEEYVAPMAGIILYKLATPPINEGDTVACIGSNSDDDDKKGSDEKYSKKESQK
ncbi:MAG: succinylglutamate desuccinylase/aspartoacylase family protein [Bacteroidota bacterium]